LLFSGDAGRGIGENRGADCGSWRALWIEGSCSFLKKRTKKLLLLGVLGPVSVYLHIRAFLASFFQKRRAFFL
jgi:hypothetical protein